MPQTHFTTTRSKSTEPAWKRRISEKTAWVSVEHNHVVVRPWSELANATLWLACLHSRAELSKGSIHKLSLWFSDNVDMAELNTVTYYTSMKDNMNLQNTKHGTETSQQTLFSAVDWTQNVQWTQSRTFRGAGRQEAAESHQENREEVLMLVDTNISGQLVTTDLNFCLKLKEQKKFQFVYSVWKTTENMSKRLCGRFNLHFISMLWKIPSVLSDSRKTGGGGGGAASSLIKH